MKATLPAAVTVCALATATLLIRAQSGGGTSSRDAHRALGTDTMQLRQILTDPQVWGQDGFATLATMQRWKNVGEKVVLVFHDRVVGGSTYDGLARAEQSAARLAAAMRRGPERLRPEYRTVYGRSTARASGFKTRAERFLEDDSYRVVVQRDGGDFLKPDITPRMITERFGQPERTTTEVVQSQGDRRPAVLTVYWYANGAVRFVESDLSRTPGAVDRAVVDLTLVVPQLY